VRTLVPTLFGFWDIIEIPVWFFMGYWILIQLLSGFGSLVAFNINEGGVACSRTSADLPSDSSSQAFFSGKPFPLLRMV
jgi:hypothetical protein